MRTRGVKSRKPSLGGKLQQTEFTTPKGPQDHRTKLKLRTVSMVKKDTTSTEGGRRVNVKSSNPKRPSWT